MNPKVFISHATEDKDRFVRDFAKKLRTNGVDAWVDEWEIIPGDSLVQKIFDEGIKGAQAVIVVLSQNSVNKPWVREELDAAIVKKINGSSKLIPIVIDDCQVPEALQSTLWQRINNLNNYDDELGRILMSIYGHRERPPIGEPPAYAQTIIDIVPGLTKVDSLVLKLSVEMAIDDGQALHIDVDELTEKADSLNIPKEEVLEALEILDKKGYHEQAKLYGGGRRYYHFKVTTFGFHEYARVYIADYDALIQAIASQIVNHDNLYNKSIAKTLNRPLQLIDFVLDVLHDSGKIRVSKAIGGHANVREVSADLKRMMREA